MFRHIAWFSEALVEPDALGKLTSPNLVARRRCLAPARELEKLGLECSVFGNLHDADPAHVAKHLEKLHADVVIITSNAHSTLVDLARAAKRLGCLVVADFDDQLIFSNEHKELAFLADQIVVSTNEASKLLNEMNVQAIVIADCDAAGAHGTAALWLESLKKLKTKPPKTANTNIPMTDNV